MTQNTIPKNPDLLSVLYWNIKLSLDNIDNIRDALMALVKDFQPELIFVAEFIKIPKEDRLDRVLSIMPPDYQPIWTRDIENDKKRPLVLFHKIQRDDLTLVPEVTRGDNYAIFQITQEGRIDAISLIPVHFRSHLSTNPASRNRRIETDLLDLIKYIRTKKSTELSFVFGDFNCNPWDQEMIDSFLLASISDRDANINKSLAGKKYPQLYNPTWALLGDYVSRTENRQPSASYFYNTHELCHWTNMFDQLLMPFTDIDHFHFPGFRFITQAGDHIFWKHAQWKNETGAFQPNYSDHLPLFFQIKLKP